MIYINKGCIIIKAIPGMIILLVNRNSNNTAETSILNEAIGACEKKSVNKKTFYDKIKSGGFFNEKETIKSKAGIDSPNDRNV